MRILYFSFVELDIPNACQTHTLGVLRGFSHNGCQVDVVVPRPVHVKLEIKNVRFYYLWPWRFSHLGRAWVKVLSSLLMFFLCAKNKYDAIYVREMEVNPGPRLCSKLFNIPLYMEINDLIVPVLSESGFPSPLLHKVKRNQKLDFRQSSGLIVPSASMCDWIINRYRLPESKVHMILNGTEIHNTNTLDRVRARNKLGLPPTCFCLGFVGNIYERYDFGSTLQAIIECQDEIPDLHFVIVGEGPLAYEVKSNAKKLGLQKKMIFTGYIQPEELTGILPAIDIGLLTLTKKAILRYGPLSTKFSTYATYRLPIIAAGFSLEGYPDELVQGLSLVPPEDPQALADTILWLYKHPEEREKKAKILHDFISKKLTWNAITGEILNIIKRDII
jgi:glycosyltransferase involved in cell wall biosynthesis